MGDAQRRVRCAFGVVGAIWIIIATTTAIPILIMKEFLGNGSTGPGCLGADLMWYGFFFFPCVALLAGVLTFVFTFCSQHEITEKPSPNQVISAGLPFANVIL